jgi:rhamnopyranosyl-N-acetylglucosaminyl-diphospho-decaprenol beta-1,3/1,4-galactofuranosyltransferase
MPETGISYQTRSQWFYLIVDMKIAAVIVTYNRLECLKRCVAALRTQSRLPDEIVIINNGSTDGTGPWLSEQKGLTVITQKNLGGAGGFHCGFQYAFEHGYDWVWSMDDDGVPTTDCLKRLIEFPDASITFRSPLVLSIENPDTLAFELLPKGAATNITLKSQVPGAAINGLLPEIATPFNGTLISRKIFEDIGFPIAELYIWGDEVEFQFRTQKAGHKAGIVVAAEFLHPKNRLIYSIFRIAGRTHGFPQRTGNPLRDYLAIRNNAYIDFRYVGFMWTIRRHCYCTLYHLLEFGPAAAWRAFCAGQAGMWGYLGGHRKYLKS